MVFGLICYFVSKLAFFYFLKYFFFFPLETNPNKMENLQRIKKIKILKRIKKMKAKRDIRNVELTKTLTVTFEIANKFK